MDYISSDTNVWIDFAVIQALELPFRLSYTYLMHQDAIQDELLTPEGLSERLLSLGLVPVEITMDEFLLAESYGNTYKKLSVYDRIALAIAKARSITLMTGDRALRSAAIQERVSVIGTIGILDKLWEEKKISIEEYKSCLAKLLQLNGKVVRLPASEVRSRLFSILQFKNQEKTSA